MSNPFFSFDNRILIDEGNKRRQLIDTSLPTPPVQPQESKPTAHLDAITLWCEETAARITAHVAETHTRFRLDNPEVMNQLRTDIYTMLLLDHKRLIYDHVVDTLAEVFDIQVDYA